jgi:hypothetical protein
MLATASAAPAPPGPARCHAVRLEFIGAGNELDAVAVLHPDDGSTRRIAAVSRGSVLVPLALTGRGCYRTCWTDHEGRKKCQVADRPLACLAGVAGEGGDGGGGR